MSKATIKPVSVKTYPLEEDLSALCDYLTRCRIPFRVTEQVGMQVVLVPHAEYEPRAREAIAAFESGNVSLDISPQGVEQSSPGAEAIAPKSPPLSFYLERFPFTLLTIFLGFVGAIFCWWSKEYTGGRGLNYVLFIPWADSEGFLVKPDLSYIFTSHEYWRLLTPAFLHFTIWHVLLNSMGVFVLGQRLELFLTRMQYVLLFLVLAIASNVIEHVTGETRVFGGLSGVVCGYVGFMWILQRYAPNPLLNMPKGVYIWVACWVAAGAVGVFELFGVGIANGAHIGGLVVGCIMGYGYLVLYGKQRSEQISAAYSQHTANHHNASDQSSGKND